MSSFCNSSFGVLVSALSLALLGGCGADGHERGGQGGEPLGAAAQADTTTIDLVSPAHCRQTSGRLVGCVLPTQPATAVTIASSAVPLRTTFTVQKTGNCSTQYPLQVTLEADHANNVVLTYLSSASAAIRRSDGQPMATVNVVDTSPWTKAAAFDQSCRVSLAVSANEPDVDSKAQAQAIIDALTADLNDKTAIARHYQALDLYANAYSFMKSVANNFLTELTNDTIQELRASAQAAIPALTNLMSQCGYANGPDGGPLLSSDDQSNILLILVDLPQLGDPNDWKNPDGGTKTLADFFGPQQQQVYATIEKIAAQAADAGDDYDTDYKNAQGAVTAAQTKLTQAKAQLAKWLQ